MLADNNNAIRAVEFAVFSVLAVFVCSAVYTDAAVFSDARVFIDNGIGNVAVFADADMRNTLRVSFFAVFFRLVIIGTHADNAVKRRTVPDNAADTDNGFADARV